MKFTWLAPAKMTGHTNLVYRVENASLPIVLFTRHCLVIFTG